MAVVHGKAEVVGVGYLRLRHVEADDAEACGDVAEFPVVVDAVDGFVGGHGVVVVVADAYYVVLVIDQVDIARLIDDDEARGPLVPPDERHTRIGQSVGLVEGVDALVLLVVGIEVVGGEDVEPVASFLHPCGVVVGHIRLPRSDFLCLQARGRTQESGQEQG